MAQQTAQIICPEAIATVRELLMDTEELDRAYTDRQIITALRANRASVNYRALKNFPVNFNFTFNYMRSGVPESDDYNSVLIAEPGGNSFQAKMQFRNWDSYSPADIWVNNYLKVETTDYTINYPEGRVTFADELSSFQIVNASYCYYKVFHAARQCLLSRLTRRGELIQWRDADAEEQYGTVEDAIKAMNIIISSFNPGQIRNSKPIF